MIISCMVKILIKWTQNYFEFTSFLLWKGVRFLKKKFVKTFNTKLRQYIKKISRNINKNRNTKIRTYLMMPF